LPVIVYLKQSSGVFCSLAGYEGLVNLKALGKHYDIILKGPSHRAMLDVQALSEIFQKLTLSLKLTRDGLMSEASVFYDFRKVPRI
jgi:DNA polymerase III epsilon subunit-like protein